MNDYHKTLTLNSTPGEVYKAITEDISDWWSNDLSGSAKKAGENFNIAFGNTKKTFGIIETKHSEKVVWKCTRAYIDMAALTKKDEWVGTRIIWALDSDGNDTNLNFTHEGLNPGFECYPICEQGWDMFLSSLRSYLETGKGMPYLKKQPREAV